VFFEVYEINCNFGTLSWFYRMYRKSKRNYLLAQQELHRCGTADHRLRNLNPNSNLVLLNTGAPRQGFVPPKGAYRPQPTQMHIPLEAGLQNPGKTPDQNPSAPSNPPDWRTPKTTEKDGESSDSSCETLTSSSECDSECEDGGTVIVNGKLSKDSLRGSNEENNKDQKSKQQNSNNIWKSGALFTLHSFESEDEPVETEEWVGFLLKTMKVN